MYEDIDFTNAKFYQINIDKNNYFMVCEGKHNDKYYSFEPFTRLIIFKNSRTSNSFTHLDLNNDGYGCFIFDKSKEVSINDFYEYIKSDERRNEVINYFESIKNKNKEIDKNNKKRKEEFVKDARKSALSKKINQKMRTLSSIIE